MELARSVLVPLTAAVLAGCSSSTSGEGSWGSNDFDAGSPRDGWTARPDAGHAATSAASSSTSVAPPDASSHAEGAASQLDGSAPTDATSVDHSSPSGDAGHGNDARVGAADALPPSSGVADARADGSARDAGAFLDAGLDASAPFDAPGSPHDAGVDGARPIDAGSDAGTGPGAGDAGCSATCAGACEGVWCVTTLASGQSDPPEIVVDQANVYWIAGSSILAVSRGGGAVSTVVSNQSGMGALALEGTSLYWEGSTGATEGFVATAPVSGGTVTTLASSLDNVGGIAVDAANVYWVSTTDGTLVRVPLAGGAAVTLASGLLLPSHVAVNATDAYVTDPATGGDGTVMRVPLPGGGVPAVFAAPADGTRIVLDAENAYWANASTGALVAQPLAGGSAVTLATEEPGAQSVEGIAVGSGTIEWATVANSNASQGYVQSVSTAGGSATFVAVGQVTPVGVAVDGNDVYWTDSLGGKVMHASAD